jgi:isopentenyldiphosphate isomerase
MSTHQTTFEYPDALQEYMVTESEFYVKNPQYNMMCCGAVIFNNEGKLLLVRRANTEQAFPNCWVSEVRSGDSTSSAS